MTITTTLDLFICISLRNATYLLSLRRVGALVYPLLFLLFFLLLSMVSQLIAFAMPASNRFSLELEILSGVYGRKPQYNRSGQCGRAGLTSLSRKLEAWINQARGDRRWMSDARAGAYGLEGAGEGCVPRYVLFFCGIRANVPS